MNIGLEAEVKLERIFDEHFVMMYKLLQRHFKQLKLSLEQVQQAWHWSLGSLPGPIFKGYFYLKLTDNFCSFNLWK